MDIVSNYLLYFIIYSIIGWLVEVLSFLIMDHKFVNRGFLLGPVCPIYGYGVVLIILLIGSNNNDLLSIFLKSIFICSILEYSTSFVMEKLFRARWWDYSQRRFNINGRICLETMLPFGIGATIVLYLVHPRVIKLVKLVPYKLKVILAVSLFSIYLVDNFISIKVMSKIKHQIKKEKVDNTVEVKNRILKWISQNSFWYKHIIKAFPKFKIMERVKKIKKVITGEKEEENNSNNVNK